jgi:hypothetical protein
VCLFCLFYSRFTSPTPKGYVDYYKRNRPRPLRTSHNKRNPPPPACAVRISRCMGPPYKSTKEVRNTKKKLSGDVYRPGLRLVPSSAASHTIHSSNLSAWAWSTSTHPSTYRPTPGNSRNLSNRLSHRGSERSVERFMCR